MFRSFGDAHSQPVAIFASKGPTTGTNLARLVMKAVILLERAGAFVDALVCNGAATNLSMWKEYSVSGNLENPINYFIHPLDDDRKVFVFADAPHLIKCVRNHLHTQKILQPAEYRIFWVHYDKLLIADTSNPGCLRVCPKLSSAHLNPTNTEKMWVKLATQIFSRSVADGLQYYSKRGVFGLENIQGTVKFTMRFNDLFHALNRRFPAQGIRRDSKDFEVLKSFLTWLDSWETQVAAGRIPKERFLTLSTAEGHRVTVMSTIELTTYLLEVCDFKYVLTSRFNQDVLERFFEGLFAKPGLYNMLSFYSLVNPPKFGNCSISNGCESCLLTLSDLTTSFRSNYEESKLETRKKRLDKSVDYEAECETVRESKTQCQKQRTVWCIT
ncbi:hypothetical protein HPB49_013463 [Dermacentor silvarum]|uniref:Uncharacterized protein n=1 Tax=Dermacentor silvarum TaxID=543639 RepID=A0ACB8CRH5_DERSI|nr:hypothetical protein HPB49_013463 [Dermacentor silvarum]